MVCTMARNGGHGLLKWSPFDQMMLWRPLTCIFENWLLPNLPSQNVEHAFQHADVEMTLNQKLSPFHVLC